MRLKIFLSGLFVALLAFPAYAHTGANVVFSLSSGFLHPLAGFDHLLAMFAVGLLAVQLGGRALWLVPGAFIVMMIAGAVFGLACIAVPGSEYAISLSLVIIALPVALALNIPPAIAMMIVGLFAVFHGHAHGSELPAGSAVIAYVAGFTAATALIHAAGIGFALGAKGVPTRIAAAAVSAVGLAFFVV
jgi:urease accessory protein